MTKNVYNIVWADDEIDELLDSETIAELESKGFKIIGQAHDGEELESLLKKPEMVDAVIVDANFNESDVEISSEKDTSGWITPEVSTYIRLNKEYPSSSSPIAVMSF